MADRPGPNVRSIAAHRGFADALVAGLVPRYGEEGFGLARLTLLLPSRRAVRTVTQAFVRLSGSGLLMPRMVVVGDLDLDETLGPLLDPLGHGADVPPPSDPVRRWLRLADLLREELGGDAPRGASLLRQAFEIGRTMDRLLVEGIAPEDLLSEQVIGVVGEQAQHWTASTRIFARIQARWLAELAARREVDPPARRNLLFDHAARAWAQSPPPHPIVAAGITSASPSLARLLRTIAFLPGGAVILPDLDFAIDDEVWSTLGTAGAPAEHGDPPLGSGDAVTHPQYHLKLLLNRMGIARSEVEPWHRSGLSAAEPARSRAISNLFLPPRASARWVRLKADERRLAGVRLMETAHPGEEAQAIAILLREALEVSEKRAALVTPDRALAARVIAHLGRWGIAADDTAGQPLPQTAAGRLFLLLAEVAATGAAPVPLIALLGHPLVRPGEERADWLTHVRRLDRALRGPRGAPGLASLQALAAGLDKPAMSAWWAGVEAILGPLMSDAEEPLALLLDRLALAADSLSGGAIWAGPAGRALSAFIDELRSAAGEVGTAIPAADLLAALRDAMDRAAVRPSWGGHPRVAIYGLIEARMSRADLVICGGLTEGTWPGAAAPDALLAPAVLRALGVPGADFRIGLSAHDLASALGAPEVVLSHARRDASGPAIPSRFVLRVRAMLGDKLLADHRETRAVDLARALDDPPQVPAAPRPHPMPDAAQRDVPIAVTGLDRLRGDPYQFYASDILRLRALDALDAEPTAAWKGTAVHAILEAWHKARLTTPDAALLPIAETELAKMNAHPLVRALWWPRLAAGLEWAEQETRRLEAEGRVYIASEARGHITVKGVKIVGRADRIDRLADGTLAVVDYKTGGPPPARQVEQGFALQLGLIGLMARAGAFKGLDGAVIAGEATRFEYWSLQKSADSPTGFGKSSEPIREGRKRSGIPREDFLPETERFLHDAIDRWIRGNEPFTARLNPDLPGYADYDQLMRLDEWQGRDSGEENAT